MGDVIASDHDHCHVRCVVIGQTRELSSEIGRLRTDDRGGAQAHGPPHPPCHSFREPSAERLLAALGAETRRHRVAQHEKLHRIAVERTAPDAISIDRLLAERFADAPTRDRRLTREHEPDADGGRDRRGTDRGEGDEVLSAHALIRSDPRERRVNGIRSVRLQDRGTSAGRNQRSAPASRAVFLQTDPEFERRARNAKEEPRLRPAA